ncbi:MAG: FHA domain-containing protein [Thermodesulfobacteriota bacterium]|nr:FHA domain-containing protein [Thermodesulfobacteriota bacterium]
MPFLTLKFKETIVNRYKLDPEKPLHIGRRKTNDIVIENLSVSGHHAKVEFVKEGFVLTDLQSKNGTYVNKKAITSCMLKDKDVVRIGMHTLIYSGKS